MEVRAAILETSKESESSLKKASTPQREGERRYSGNHESQVGLKRESSNGDAAMPRSGSSPNCVTEVVSEYAGFKIPKLKNRICSSPSLTRRVSEPEKEKEKQLCEVPLSVIGKSPSVPELTSQSNKALIHDKEQNYDRRVNSVANFRRGTRSQWAKLRSAVQSVAVVRSEIKKRKMSELQREDSFLRRFSTRSYARRSVGSATDSVEDGGQVYAYPEEIDDKNPEKKWSVFRPNAAIMFYWMCLVSIAVFYNLWVCIAREAFREIQDGYEVIWICIDVLADVVYVMDILVQFRTGYLEQGLIVTQSNRLASHYIHSWCFLLDIFAIIPFDFIQFKIGIHPIIRLNRFFKSYRIFRFIYMLESRTSYPNLFRVTNLMHILFLGCHWFAGFYYMISEAENFRNRWTYPFPNGTFASVSRKYLMSLYWSTLTLTTIGDLHPPNENIEYLFVIVSYLIGVFVFATIVGQVGSVITNRNSRRQDFERLVFGVSVIQDALGIGIDSAKTYMRRHNVPRDMRKRVMRWYDYVWTRGRVDGKWDINTLGLLPDKLKTELAIHVNLQTLRKVTIFQVCQPEFLHDLVLKMKAYIFTPGDVICRYGEVAREMFIIADGIVEVISESGTVLTRMNPGDFFGEIGILNLDGGINRRTADVRSVGYSELFVLSRDDVLLALEDHPDAAIILKEYGKKRLDAIRKLNTYSVTNSEVGAPVSDGEAPALQETALDTLLITPEQRRQSLTRSFSTSCIRSIDHSRHIQVELMRSLEGCCVTKSPSRKPTPLADISLKLHGAVTNSVPVSTVDDDSQAIPSIVIEPASPDKDKAPPTSSSGSGGTTTAVECAVAAAKEILLDRWREHENTFRSIIKVLEDERRKRESVIFKMQTRIDSLELELSQERTKKSCEALRHKILANARAAADKPETHVILESGEYDGSASAV